MRNPINRLLHITREIFVGSKNKKSERIVHLSIEKKWWMGEDLFIDQKPFITNTLKNKHIQYRKI